MLKMSDNNDPSSPAPPSSEKEGYAGASQTNASPSKRPGLIARLIGAFKPQQDSPTLREAIEEYVVEPENTTPDPVTLHEKEIFSNILKLRDIPVYKIMVPRADIVAIDVDTPPDEVLSVLAEKQYSRIPVYKGTLDDVIGTIHLKDVIRTLAQGKDIILKDIITEIPIVSPAMPALDLLLTMRETRRHMALVVDEYGGIDGLVTIGDVGVSIVGEIDDEHDIDEAEMIASINDGSIVADARVYIEDFEEEYGEHFSEEEREENETLGGLVFMLAGRVPVRGEVLNHDSGIVFEVLDADQRRIKRLKISQSAA